MFTARFRKLQFAENEHVLNNADICHTFCPKSTVHGRADPYGSAQSPCIIHGSGHLWTLAYALWICMCPQDCVVPYGAVRYHVDICTSDMHSTLHSLNEPVELWIFAKNIECLIWPVFTTLHGMQTQYSNEKAVRLSVRLLNVWIVTKRKKDLSRFLYHTKDHLA